MRMNRKEFPTVFPEGYRFDLFKADLLRAGTDVTILAAGLMVSESLQAAETLAAEGISCEVINVHTIKPIDRETILASAKKTGVIVTAENHNVIGGLRSAVLEALAHDPVPVWAVGAEDRFGEVGRGGGGPVRRGGEAPLSQGSPGPQRRPLGRRRAGSGTA